jgi:radical SAM superfamily enzyme YgiQ (UPF0313 family)
LAKGPVVNPRRTHTFDKASGSFEREHKFSYAYEMTGVPVQIKRGCNQACKYCVEPIIEGKRIVFREIDDVINELEELSKSFPGTTIFFVDTEFNIPDLNYCTTLVKKILDAGLHEYFRFSTQMLPRPFDSDFCRILSETGFSIIITCDSFSDEILERNGASYRQVDIIRTLKICEEHGLSCTLTMIFGLPGESYKTIDHTLEQMNRYPPNFLRRYEYTVGGRIFQGTSLCRDMEKGEGTEHLYGRKTEGYLEPFYYCSPASPLILKDYIQKEFPYPVAYENDYDKTRFQTLALGYLIDQRRFEDAASRFNNTLLPAQTSIYDYYFRKLADVGRIEDARNISMNLLEKIRKSQKPSEYGEHLELIKYYLSLLNQSPT